MCPASPASALASLFGEAPEGDEFGFILGHFEVELGQSLDERFKKILCVVLVLETAGEVAGVPPISPWRYAVCCLLRC